MLVTMWGYTWFCNSETRYIVQRLCPCWSQCGATHGHATRKLDILSSDCIQDKKQTPLPFMACTIETLGTRIHIHSCVIKSSVECKCKALSVRRFRTQLQVPAISFHLTIAAFPRTLEQKAFVPKWPDGECSPIYLSSSPYFGPPMLVGHIVHGIQPHRTNTILVVLVRLGWATHERPPHPTPWNMVWPWNTMANDPTTNQNHSKKGMDTGGRRCPFHKTACKTGWCYLVECGGENYICSFTIQYTPTPPPLHSPSKKTPSKASNNTCTHLGIKLGAFHH